MVQDVFADLLFLINFSMDYICLYITVKILHQKIKLSRILLSSAIGGIYSVAALFLPFSSAIELLVDAVICILMCVIAFAGKGRPASKILLYGFLFTGVSMMVGGCMTAIFNALSKLDLPLYDIPSDNISTYLFAILAAIAGIISLRSGQIISHRSSIKKCRLTITFCNKKFEFSGLCDSGNLVRDPISHKPVIFLDRKRLQSEIDLSFMDEYAKGHLPKDSPCKSLRLIMINTASGTSVLVAAVPQSIELYDMDKKSKSPPDVITLDALIAPTDILKNSDGYDAIVPAEIIKDI